MNSDDNTKYTQQPETAEKPVARQRIFKPFFVAGISVLLSVGALWGAINLFFIGEDKNFAAIDYSWVLAHGHAMVFGFVGLFIMGFAYQAFPGFKQTSLWKPKLAYAALPIMLAGLILQMVAHVMEPHTPFLGLGVLSAIIQIGSVIIFAVVMVKTIQNGAVTDHWDRFVYAALGWFILSALLNPVVFWLFEAAASEERFLFNVSTFNIPYRDIQLLGMAVVMILGVSLRILPEFFGLHRPSKRWGNFLLYSVNGAIVISVIAFIAAMVTENRVWMALYQLSAIVLLIVAIGSPKQFRMFRTKVRKPDRGLKFIRAAYIWFIIAMGLLVLNPVYTFGIYMPLVEDAIPFSHAYFGAYRHALTVGFILMMIVGVSSRFVPDFSGIDHRKTNSLWIAFILLNLGNALRVTTEIATDFVPAAYQIMGLSGFIEVIALGLWGYEMIRNMVLGNRIRQV